MVDQNVRDGGGVPVQVENIAFWLNRCSLAHTKIFRPLAQSYCLFTIRSVVINNWLIQWACDGTTNAIRWCEPSTIRVCIQQVKDGTFYEEGSFKILSARLASWCSPLGACLSNSVTRVIYRTLPMKVQFSNNPLAVNIYFVDVFRCEI